MADADLPRTPEPTAAPPAGTSAIDLTGRTLGDFQILRKIGTGGMGQVYLARQLSLKREVAVKLLRNDLADNPKALKRFEAEAHAVARLNHPNIVQVYHLGESDGLRYMVLEYVEGRNLRDYLVRRGPPDLPITLSVIRQVSLALQKAHEQGIVHRDIKPENILVTRKVEVKVTDFGLSRFFAAGSPELNLTQSGITLGTPLYMSPEQVKGDVIDQRSDIYSFGVTCYHLLSGEPPFRGSTAYDVAMKHVHEAPRPLAELRPDLPADLCGMVHKMMAKDPAERYQSTRDMLRDLAKVREGIGLGLPQAAASGAISSTLPGSPSVVLSMSGTTFGEANVPSGSTVAMSASMLPAKPIRWGRWLVLSLVCAVAAAGGAVVYGRLHPLTEAKPADSTGVLPDIRPPVKASTTRERELNEVVNKRESPDADVIAASIELGLLYLREGWRLKDAEASFKKLAGEKLRTPLATEQAQLAGRFGQGVVLAHMDKAKESHDMFVSAISKGSGKPGGGKVGGTNPAKFKESRDFLINHTALHQAVAEAIERNNVNLRDKVQKNPYLESLRQAREVTKPVKE